MFRVMILFGHRVRAWVCQKVCVWNRITGVWDSVLRWAPRSGVGPQKKGLELDDGLPGVQAEV